MKDWLILGLKHELEELDIEKINELNELLGSLGIHFDLRESIGCSIFGITYDREQIISKLNRGAGAKPIYMDHSVLVDEIKRRTENESTEDIAKSLGISRSTLFRKLKHAKESGYNYII